MSGRSERLKHVDQLGERVWEVLANAGHREAPEGCGRDGFDVLRSSVGSLEYVVVVARFEGALLGCGSKDVRRQVLYRFGQSLLRAGLVVEPYEPEGFPAGLVVAEDADAAKAGLCEVLAALAAERAEVA